MKCTNRRVLSIILTAVLGLQITGCGQEAYAMAYTPDYAISSYRIVHIEDDNQSVDTFASDLCVVAENITDDENVDMSQATGAALFGISNSKTIYAKNVYEKLYPASLTKIMTALVALKYGSSDMMLIATGNVKITESGAQVCGIKQGDQMTLDQALHLLLINSANDAAIMIAEGVAGSVEGFVNLMNQEALEIGATNSHFMNPHGLSDDNHFTTVYDMYLMLNEAVKYELFNEIIQMSTYTTVYHDKNGDSKEVSVNSTNLYLQGEQKAPENITVLGGKTGTTNAAGHCLAIVSKDSSGNPYISIILRADSRDAVYAQMTDLLGEIAN